MDKNANSDLLSNLEISVFSDLTYDDSLLLAEKSLQNYQVRESLYYLEEALFEAREQNNSENETFVLNKIGEILTKTGNFSDAKVFCDLIFENHSLRLNFSCHNSGSCCKELKVNVTSKDILTILKHRPDLKPDDFLTLPQNSFMEKFLAAEPQEEIIQGNKWLFHLKKHQDKTDCIFLKNNLCTIHDFKPVICKNWPLYITHEDRIRYDNIEFMIDNCHYCVEPVNNKEDIIKGNLRILKNDFSSDQHLALRLQEKILVKKEVLTRNDIINFILDSAAKEEKYIENINQIIKKQDTVLKIISFYFPLPELKDYFQIGIYTSENLINLAKKLFQSLKDLNPEQINLNEENNSIKIILFLEEDFKFQLNFYSEDKLAMISSENEKVLYENSNYNFPNRKTDFKIYYDHKLFTLIIKALETVIKGELKRNNDKEVTNYLEKLNSFYNNDSPQVISILGNKDNTKLTNLLNNVIINIEEYSLIDLKKGDKNSLLQFLEKLDIVIEKNDIFYFDYYLKKLRIYNYLNQTQREEKLITQIILLGTDDESKKKKLIKVLAKLRRNYTEPVKNIICNILKELYNSELTKKKFSKVIFYIQLFHEFYNNNPSNSFDPIYKKSIFELGKAYLKTNNKPSAEMCFEKLLKIIEDNEEKFEFLFSIADEYHEEDFNEQAIFYFIKALQICNENFLTERFLILDTIIDLYFKTKNYHQVRIFIDKQLELTNQYQQLENTGDKEFNFSVKKIQSLVNLAKLNYLVSEFAPGNPLLYLENLEGTENIEFLLSQYFIDLLKKKIITLPIKLDNLYFKFASADFERLNINIFAQEILTLIKTLSELLIINLEMRYIEKIFQQDKRIQNLFFTARLYVEFTDYHSAIIYFEDLTNLYSLSENPDKNILFYLKTYNAYLYELEGNINKANKYYYEIYKESNDKRIKNIYELSIFNLRSLDQNNKINTVFLKNLFRYIALMKDSIFE